MAVQDASTDASGADVDEGRALTLGLRAVTLAVQNFRLRAARATFDVGATEMMALAELYAFGPSSPGDLAQFLSITSASTTSLLDRLERAGHVARSPHPSDRRRIVVELTPPAAARLEVMFSFTGEATARAVRGLGPGERAAVLAFLREVAQAYDQIDPSSWMQEPSPAR